MEAVKPGSKVLYVQTHVGISLPGMTFVKTGFAASDFEMSLHQSGVMVFVHPSKLNGIRKGDENGITFLIPFGNIHSVKLQGEEKK